jgi:hypothetical protein
MYSIDWNKLIKRQLPSALRKDRMISFIYALIGLVTRLHSDLLAYIDRVRLDIQMNGQVRRLEYGLNDLFDVSLRRIEIKDATDPEFVFVFLESENMPLYLPTFLSGQSVDFLVCVPAELEGDEISIRAFLDRHKLVTKRYRIEYV